MLTIGRTVLLATFCALIEIPDIISLVFFETYFVSLVKVFYKLPTHKSTPIAKLILVWCHNKANLKNPAVIAQRQKLLQLVKQDLQH